MQNLRCSLLFNIFHNVFRDHWPFSNATFTYHTHTHILQNIKIISWTSGLNCVGVNICAPQKKKQIFFFHLNLWATRNEWIKIWLRHVLVFLYLYEKVVKVGRLCFDCFLFGCGIICWFRFRFGHSFGSENSERNQSKPTRHERRNKISIVILQMFGWNTWCRHGATSEPHSTTITHIWTNIKKPLKYLNDIISYQSWEVGRICCSFPTLRECSIDQTQTTRTEIQRKKMYDFY